MIRMIQSMSSGAAKSYFSSSLNQADYYINDQELQGRFYGKLAHRLGLKEAASKNDFFALCENIHPHTGNSLTPRTKQERTVGYDINFHCPKSVSIVHALSGDEHILKLFQSSVGDTMREMEQDMMTRVRKGGRYEDRPTGELLWAEFTHQTARPVEGFVPDPHLHSHCFTFNATWDEQENSIKAGQFRNIKRDMPYYQAKFHKILSDKLMDGGYQIKRTKASFEIVGVPEQVIDHFSKRTDEIGRIAAEKGITDAKGLDALGAKTRSKKQKGMSMQDLRSEWRKQIKALDADEIKNHESANVETPIRTLTQKRKVEPYENTLHAQECVNHAIKHSFERASVMADRRIVMEAYRHGIGEEHVSVNDIDSSFSKDSRLIRIQEHGKTMCTTKEVLHEEKRMVETARRGIGKMQPLYSKVPELQLTGQQAEAVQHVLTTSNRISIIRGAAGSGKTTLMKEAVAQMGQAGKKVIVLAPTAQASRGVLKEEGFENAETVAKFLVDPQLQDNLKDQILWVDEAGLLGTQDMSRLLEITEQQNARLILGGDTRQHASVVRGDALRILNTVGGIKTAEVNKIYRQKQEQYRSAVEDLSKGAVRDAFDKLDDLGSLKAVDPMDATTQLAEDYVSVLKKGKSALIISPTHKQGEQVTDKVRVLMRKKGMLGKKEIMASKLTSLNLTESQKSDSRNYKSGQIVQFNQNIKNIKRGSAWKVSGTDGQNILIENSNGTSIPLPKNQEKKFDVFEEKEIALSKGDSIQITKNGFDTDKKRLNNGQTLKVKSVSKKGHIILVNPSSKALYTIDKDFGHINHAHCITSYASQGKTVDEVFISQPASTFPATDAKQFYVSTSRAREAVHIYTDDKTALLEHASELGDRQSAIELVNKHSHQDHVFQNFTRNNQKTKTNTIKDKFIDNIKTDHDYEPGF